jgi:hypothetical protein
MKRYKVYFFRGENGCVHTKTVKAHNKAEAREVFYNSAKIIDTIFRMEVVA